MGGKQENVVMWREESVMPFIQAFIIIKGDKHCCARCVLGMAGLSEFAV